MWNSLRWLFLVSLTVIAALCLHLWGHEPATATAPQAPYVVSATLNGKPVSVLYMTRAGDRVLVRCYPGQTPTMNVYNTSQSTKEGSIVCN